MQSVIKQLHNFQASLKNKKLLFWFFLLIGSLIRFWQLGNVPGGINQDEAFGAYEAYSMLNYGMDSWGYRFPVYLTTWGSGMSALNSYLMIPCIALFGLHTWVIRLPQAIVGCLTLCAVYGIVRRMLGENAALFALFFTAIAPWHIMQSRWGLDCNLAPGFLLFGLYFFLRGLEHQHYLLLSALMYGLSLYCYATIWPIVPLIIGLEVVYCLVTKKLSISWYLAGFVLILGLLAFPLLLFLLVNYGIVEEILLPFLSIPRLPYMRAGEVSLSNIPANLRNLWYLMHEQTDGLIWNVIDSYGIFYRCSFPFFLLGIFYYVKRTLIHWYRREFAPEFFLLIQLGTAVLLGLLIETNINRINILFLPMIILAASGIYFLCSLIHRRLLAAAFLIYSVLFISFAFTYFTGYRDTISYWFCEGLEDALEAAEQEEGEIYISSSVSYPRIMYYSRIPVTEYQATVRIAGEPGMHTEVTDFGRYHFIFGDISPMPDTTYILDGKTQLLPFTEAGFTLSEYGEYTLAIPPSTHP